MRWLKILLAINGAVFLYRAYFNIFQPTSYYLESDAPKSAVDVVHVIGITFVALGLIQMGMWRVTDRLAVRIVAGASLLFAAGMFGQASTQGSASADTFHQISLASAAENALVVALYATLLYLYRESQVTSAVDKATPRAR